MNQVPLNFGVPNRVQQDTLDLFRQGKRVVLMVGGRQIGKALSVDTEVPTPTGWTTMGSIKPGDEVFAPDGSVTTVDWVSEVELKPDAYKLTLDDGTEILADGGHEWISYTKAVRKSMGRAKNPSLPITLTTREMAETQIYGGDGWYKPNGRRREANHALKVPKAIECSSKELPIDPYVFGVWLGDGSSTSGMVTSRDDELWERVQGLGYSLGKPQKRENSQAVTCTILGIFPILRELGVLGNKRIPMEYQRASREQRMELLKGLMDTDGYAYPGKGMVDFYSSNLELIQDVRELISGLGMKSRLNSKKATIGGKDYGLTYRVTFNPHEHVFHLTRKRTRQELEGRLERDMRYVHSIERVDPIPMRCLAVSHPSHEFLVTRQYVPTHNSHVGARWLITQTMQESKNKLAFAVSPTYRMSLVVQRKLEEVLKLDPRLWKRMKVVKSPVPRYTFPNGWVIEVHSSDDPDALRGPTVDAVWYDEIAKGAEESFDILMPTLLASGGKLLGTTTPRGKHNWIYPRIAKKAFPPGHPEHDPEAYNQDYGIAYGSTWDNVDNLSEEAIEALEEQYGKTTAFGKQEISGEFVSFDGLVFKWDEKSGYIPYAQLPPREEFSQVVGGIDFGWTDPTAVVVMGYKDGVWYALDGFSEQHLTTNEIASRVSGLGLVHKVTTWYADSAQPSSIADLQSRGIPVTGVKKPLIEERIREMAMFTDTDRFKISTKCDFLKDEMLSYSYPPNQNEMMGPRRVNPVDKNNHAIDSSGYALWSMRWLWRNDESYHKTIKNPAKEEDSYDKYRKRLERERTRVGRYSRAGLAGE